MKHLIEIGYAFQVLSAPISNPEHKLRGSVFIHFQGIMDLGQTLPRVNVPFAIVPPRLRQIGNRGIVRVTSSRRVNLTGLDESIYWHVQFESIVEKAVTEYDWGIEPLKQHGVTQIENIVKPYMMGVLGLQPVGEAPYIGIW